MSQPHTKAPSNMIEVLEDVQVSLYVGGVLVHSVMTGITPESIILPYSDDLLSKEGSVSRLSINAPLLGYKDLEVEIVDSARASDDLLVCTVAKSERQSKLDALISSLRKEQHINLCSKKDVEHSKKFTGFEEFSFIPSTLPELNFDDVDISTTFLGSKFSAPIFVTGMTGGVKSGGNINEKIARACEKYGIAMGVGSQRIALEHPEYSDIFDVKKFAPNLFLIGNIGVAQLAKGLDVKACQKAVDMINADALALHVNVLQELIQVEGDRNFSGLLDKIESVCTNLSVPVIIKEVGSGVDIVTAKKLSERGVSAIDVGGSGGTSWGYIEGLRATSERTKNLANTFRNWGIPTAYNVATLSKAGFAPPITATGGIRDGLTAAKAISLGATMAGIGLPIFKAAVTGNQGMVEEKIEEFITGIKITSMLTGSRSLNDLKGRLCKGLPYQQNEL